MLFLATKINGSSFAIPNLTLKCNNQFDKFIIRFKYLVMINLCSRQNNYVKEVHEKNCERSAWLDLSRCFVEKYHNPWEKPIMKRKNLYVFPEYLTLWVRSERLLSNAQQLSDKLSLSPLALSLPEGQVLWKV